MKEVGDKFGAGELILPFVLQSAEVMKRAVAQLENYLDRIEGHTKGTVVIATVFGDVHDIGKSLVNTILTNNGYTVVDLGKQVPIEQIIDAAVDHEADAIGLSALLVSTSKQMPACIQELHQRGLDFPVLIGGAAINRDFGRRALYPHGRESDEIYEPGVFYCKDAFVGLDTVDSLIDDEAREALVVKFRDEAKALREKPVVADDSPPTTDDSVRSAVSTTTPIPAVERFGVRDVDVDLAEVFPYLDRHVLFKLHWGGRGVKGEAWRKIVEGDGEEEGFSARLERMWAEQDYLHPKARIGFFPANADGNELVVFDPEDPDRELERLVFPRQPKHDRICLSDFFRPIESGERDVVVLQGVTAGSEVTERIEQLERDGEFAEQLFVHGLGVQSAEGMAEWLHAQARARARDRTRPGAPLLVGLPGLSGAVRAREGLATARARGDRDEALDRLGGGARAVDGGDHRPPPAGRLLRHEVRLRARRAEARRADRGNRARRRAAARRRPRQRRHDRLRGRRAGPGRRLRLSRRAISPARTRGCRGTRAAGRRARRAPRPAGSARSPG